MCTYVCCTHLLTKLIQLGRELPDDEDAVQDVRVDLLEVLPYMQRSERLHVGEEVFQILSNQFDSLIMVYKQKTLEFGMTCSMMLKSCSLNCCELKNVL